MGVCKEVAGVCPGDELGFRWTVLVGKERQTKGRMATAIPTKGGATEWWSGEFKKLRDPSVRFFSGIAANSGEEDRR